MYEAVKPRLEALLEESPTWTDKKQQLTATRLHALLVGDGLKVGVTLVKEAVAGWKRQRREVYVPLVYRPGELAEVDFFEVLIDEAGHRRKAWMSRTPGHPERGCPPGVEVTPGRLGQGVGNGVGMAIAERWLAATFNRQSDNVVDHWTYVLASDGDLMEGVASEAASLAGALRLGRLIVLDANLITLAATTNLTFSETLALGSKPTAGTCSGSTGMTWRPSMRRSPRHAPSRIGRRLS